MRLSNSTYNFCLELIDGTVNVLIVENSMAFSDLVSDLMMQQSGQEGSFILSEADKVYNFSQNVDFIVNPLDLDINNKKVLNKMYLELNDLANTEMYMETLEMQNTLITYITSICNKYYYAVSSDDKTDILGLLKLYGVKIDSEGMSHLEYIVEYVKAMHRICNVSVFVFLNLKHFFNKEELILLYEFFRYENINGVLIEGSSYDRINNEKQLIIDDDLCVISC